MAVSRNAPCPCGSGKKYKKCCLGKEVKAGTAPAPSQPGEAASEPLLSPPAAPQPPREYPQEKPRTGPPEKPPDPQAEAWNARWEEFEAEDYEGQMAVFLKTLDEPELMDNEMAIEMLARIYESAIQKGECARLDALVCALRERRPEVYQQSAHHYLEWEIAGALADGRLDALPARATELAKRSGRDLDIVEHAMDQLAYHGQVAVLVEMTRAAWPEVQASGDLVSWAADDFAERGISYEVCDHLARAAAPNPTDPDLLGRLAPYTDSDPGWVAEYLGTLTQPAPKAWSLSDFPTESRGGGLRLTEEGDRNLKRLCIGFVRYARNQEGVPHTKGDLAAWHIREYLLKRLAGELVRGERPFEIAKRRGKRFRPPTPRAPDHLLCPDHATLDFYLSGQLHFLNPQYYKAAVTIELMPAWLRYLEACGLVEPHRAARTLSALADLAATLSRLCKPAVNDPALHRALAAWPAPPPGS